MIIELESECSFDAKLNNHFYVRAPCVRPVYLGAASQKMGEDSVNVWYGMDELLLLDHELLFKVDLLLRLEIFLNSSC